jgi:hypothetical protein
MAEAGKKTKAAAKPRKVAQKKEMAVQAAKPRKAAPKKVKAVQAAKPAPPSREEIERLARSYWAARGYQDGFAEEDWLRAEKELLKKAS